MPSAFGFVKGIGSNKFTAAFVVDDVQYTFNGNIDPAMQPFDSNQATLEYDSVDQLSSSRQFNGRVGTEDIELTASNGLKIRGPLRLPVSPACSISGVGVWQQD